MNSVDGAPNATTLAEGAPTIEAVTISESTNTTTTTTATTTTAVCAKTTEATIITTSVINTTTVADATDEFCETGNNEQVCGVDDQLQQQQCRNEAPIIITTISGTVATPIDSATITINTMGNTKTTNMEIADNTAPDDADVDADAAEASTSATTTFTAKPPPPPSPTVTAKQTTETATTNMQEPAASDVRMTDMATQEGNDVTTTASDTAAAVIDNTAEDAKPQPLLTAEGDNWELNEMELCRCCGKPNVTLYDLFPNDIADDNNANMVVVEEDEEEQEEVEVEEEEGNTIENAKVMAAKVSRCDGNHSVVEDLKNGAQTKQTQTAADAPQPPSSSASTLSSSLSIGMSAKETATKTNVSATKIDCEASNTPKRCYRTIAASIAAAAASSNNTTGTITGAPTCQKTNDPVVADAIATAATNGGDGVAVAVEAGGAVNTSVARVKKSATVAVAVTSRHAAAGAPNNNNNKDQNSDNMENILQEMQIWQLWINSNDGLPQRICPKCTAQFYIIHKFRRKCLKVQIRLRSLLDKTKGWEYEELLARATAEQSTEEQQEAQQRPKSKSKSMPNNCQRRQNQATQTDELETALSVNLPPVLDIGNDLINDNNSKSPRTELKELAVNAANSHCSKHHSRTSNKLSAATGTTPKSTTAAATSTNTSTNTTTTTTTSATPTTSRTPEQNPLLDDEPTKPQSKARVPSNDLTTLDVEAALGRDVNRQRSGGSVDQESLLATHIIFKPATPTERAKTTNTSRTTAATTAGTATMMRTRSARKKPASQTNEAELSLAAAKVKDDEAAEVAREDDCLAAVNDGDDDDDDEVKNEALARAEEAVATDDAAMSVEATAKTASLPLSFPSAGEPKRAESCERRRAKRVCERGGGEGARETEAEIASAAVFMDTRHAYSTTRTGTAKAKAMAMAKAAATSCDADTLIARCGGDCGGNVIKAIADDEATTETLMSSCHNKADDGDLLRPAVVVTAAKATTPPTPMDVVDDVPMMVQQKPISGQAAEITMGRHIIARTTAKATATGTVTAATAAPSNDVQSSKQTVEASEISNLPILPATTRTTTCNNETVKDGAAASQIIASETDASKAAAAAAAAVVDNNRGVVANTLKSSLNWSLSLRNVNGGENRLPTDERFAVENVPVTDVDCDDEGVETLMATVELRPQTATTTTTALTPTSAINQTIKSNTTAAMISDETMLFETTTSASNSTYAASSFVTKAALKAYSTSPKCRSLARRHMQRKMRRTLKGPIAQLLATSPASTSAAAAAFTAMHYKKKQIRRSLAQLSSESAATKLDVDATTTAATVENGGDNSAADGRISPSPQQPTFSYYATARRGRRRLKWRARSRLPCFDKHTRVESVTNDGDADDRASVATDGTPAQHLPSCFVRLRRLEATELSDEVTKYFAETAPSDAVEYANVTDVHMAGLIDSEFEAITTTSSLEDAYGTRITLKRKLPAETNESSASTRSPWRTKAEMKESLEQQSAMEDEEDEQLVLCTQDEVRAEIQKTEMHLSLAETNTTAADNAANTSVERRSKRIKKRRKLLEETHKPNVPSAGKVMPIILKLVQEKRPEGCTTCAPKSAAAETTAAQSVRGTLTTSAMQARYHVVGGASQQQSEEATAGLSQKRRRVRPRRLCCPDGCLTDDTTEDENAPTGSRKPPTYVSLPPQFVTQNKGKMIIGNVNILNVNGCAEATKENCDNNKNERTAAATANPAMSLPTQLVPLLPLLPALLPTTPTCHNGEASALSPTKVSPPTPMSLKTFSTLMSTTTTKPSTLPSPTKSAAMQAATKSATPSLTIATKASLLSSPTSSSTANPVSVVLRNQLIVRVPLSALSAEFQRKFLTTSNSMKKTPTKASATSVESDNATALTTLTTKSTGPQATESAQEVATVNGKALHGEHNNLLNSNSSNKPATDVCVEATATQTCSTKPTIDASQLPIAGDKQLQPTGDASTLKCNSQYATQLDAANTQYMRYNGGGGVSQHESEQSDFMGFSDGTGSSPNRRVVSIASNSTACATSSLPTAATATIAGAKLHDFISEFAPELADESEAPQANELQATLTAGDVTAALLAEAEAEAEIVAPLCGAPHAPIHPSTQLLSESNLSEMQDVENTLSGILNEMQDQHIYTPVSSSADDFFAQSVYSPLSEPPATPTHSMYAESPLGGVGSVGSSSMAGGGGSLSVASSPYVQHMHMEQASGSSGQMSEPSPLPAPMSVGPVPHQHQHQQQHAQNATAGYGKPYANGAGNKYGECFTEDSTQSELIGFQNDIPCFENIELAAAAANNASASPASSHNGQSAHDMELTPNGVSAVPVVVAAGPIERQSNSKLAGAEAAPVQYLGIGQANEVNADIGLVCATGSGVQVHTPTPSLPVESGEAGAVKEYAVDSATLAQLLNDFQATENAEAQRADGQDEVADGQQQQQQMVQQRRQQQHLVRQQLVAAEVVPGQQLAAQPAQAELLLQQQQREEELLKQQQLLQQQQQQQEHLLQQQLLEQQQQEQLLQQQQLLEQQRQQQALEQQRLQQQQQQQLLERQRKQQQQQQRPQIIHQAMLATPKQQHGQPGQPQKQHYIALPPSCAYEAAQMQLAQAANSMQPVHNLGVGVNLYAHGLGNGQDIQWTSTADLAGLSPAIIEAPAAGGGTTTYYISASDLYQPNLIAATAMQQQHPHHHHHQHHNHHQQQHQQQQQQRHAQELEKCTTVDANENYIEGMSGGVGGASSVQQRQACQQQQHQQQQQQQIMIVIPQEYGSPGANGATPQLYTTTGGTADQPATYQLSQAPQTLIMQHAQPQLQTQALPSMSALQVNGVNMSPQYIAGAPRAAHHAPSPQHLQHYQLQNVTPPTRAASALSGSRPQRCASTPSASHYQQRQQQLAHPHPHPQQQQQRQPPRPQVRILQQPRARHPTMQQHQLIQPHLQPRPPPQPTAAIAHTAAAPSQKVNLVCRFCHKRPKFTSNLDYSNHIIAMHPVETPYNCPHCPMHFTRRVKRQQHIVEEHGAHRFQCAQCGQSFCTQRALDQHLQRAHALDPTQTTFSAQSTPALTAALQQRQSRQQHIQSAAPTQAAASQQLQHSPSRRKCYLQQRPTWLESRNRTAAMASAAAAAAAASNSQTPMVRVEDVHLQVCDDATNKGKKSIDLQLDTTQLTAESTTPTNTPCGSGNTSAPSSSGGKPQLILCCPDCDDPFNEEHSHAQPCAALQTTQEHQLQHQQQQHQQQQEQQQQQQQHAEFDQHEEEEDEEDETTFEQQQQQLLQHNGQLLEAVAKSAHVTLPSPEQTEPDSTSTSTAASNTATLRHFRKRRASAKFAGGMPAMLASAGGGNSTAAAALISAAAGNSNATEDELLLMERVLRNSHNCLFCDARFTNDIALRKHHQLAHSNQASMPFVCSICKRGFRMRTALQRHMETHDSEGRPYECTLCHVRFPRPSQLTLHKLTVHFLRKPHACEVCGKQFGTESALKTHCKFHAAPTVECDVCKKKFFLKKDLRKHKRLHTGERFYKCDFCASSFMHYTRLRAHMKTHMPLGVFMSEDALQLPQSRQQELHEEQQPELEYEEGDEAALTAATEVQQPQVEEVEQPQVGEVEEEEREQLELEQLLEDEPQDVEQPQTAEQPQAYDDEDVTTMPVDSVDDDVEQQQEHIVEEVEGELEVEVAGEEEEVEGAEAGAEQEENEAHEQLAEDVEDQEHEPQQQQQQNADDLMFTASCSPSTTTGASPYAFAEGNQINNSDISTTTTVSTASNANRCSSSAK